MAADGTGQVNLTQTPSVAEFGTAFSPDGAQISFTGTGGPVPAGERYVQVMAADGGDRRVLVPTPGLLQAVPAWQPLGSRTMSARSVTAVLGLLAASLVATPGTSQAAGDIIVVTTTIQAAVDAADPGDTVLVPAGTYAESVNVTEPGITVRGSRGAVLDGTGLDLLYGIRVRSLDGSRLDGFTLEGLTIRGYSRYGSQVSGVDNFRLTGTRYLDNPLYGLFPVRCSHGRVDHNEVSGSYDSGVYVGQCSDVLRGPQRGARQHHRPRGRALHAGRRRGQRVHRQRARRAGADLAVAPREGDPGRARAPQRAVRQQPAEHDHRGLPGSTARRHRHRQRRGGRRAHRRQRGLRQPQRPGSAW